MDHDQLAGRDMVVDRPSAEPESKQLSPRDVGVLALS
jgi:hypothetical protein